MDKFFLVVEIMSYLFGAFLFFRKRDLSVVYLPFLIFAHNIIDPVFSASVFYGMISILILQGIYRNGDFYRRNIFAIMLFFYLALLLTRSGDFVAIRPDAFSVFWLVISLPLMASIYTKYEAGRIFQELTICAMLILALFISNVLLSSVNHFSPTRMYGITGGVLYGNVYAAGFNILSIAMFIVGLRFVITKKILYLFLLIVAYSFVMLSLRRSVMLVSSIGIIIAMLTVLFKKDIRKFIFLGSMVFLLGYLIYSNTSFEDEFRSRYELRQLNDRALENEPRFFEYELVYRDMFMYNAYSPLIGYELFRSAGNYGKGVFELRSLHGDIPSIVHSSGILGLALYALAVISVFRRSVYRASSYFDKSVILFSATAFVVFTITGRFTESGCMLLMFSVLMLPLTQKLVTGNEEREEEVSGPSN